MQNIVVDGVEYRVRVVYESLSRSFSIVEGPNCGTAITARSIRDIIGTKYAYEMNIEPDPRYPEDYDAFYETISAPVESHIVEMPYGNGSTKFEAMIVSGEDTYRGILANRNAWQGLRVQFKPILPQRTR